MAPRRASDSRADAERSFEQLYRGHRSHVYRAALRALGNSEDAEDVTQAAFVDAYRAVLRGTRPQAPRAWLLTIAENVRRRRFRTSLRRPREEPLDADAALAAEESHEQASALLEALATLTDGAARGVPPPRDRGSLVRRDRRSRWTRRSPPCRCCCSARGRRSATSSSRRRLYGALFPLATLFSRLESFSLTPRAAGAVGAAVVAVERERQRAGQCRSRAREPGSDARRSRSSALPRPHRSRAPVAATPAKQAPARKAAPQKRRAAAKAPAARRRPARVPRRPPPLPHPTPQPAAGDRAARAASPSRRRTRATPPALPVALPAVPVPLDPAPPVLAGVAVPGRSSSRCSRRSSSHCSRMPARRAPLGPAPYRCQCCLSTRCRPYRDER